MADSTGKLILLLGALSCVAEQSRANSTGGSNSRACFECDMVGVRLFRSLLTIVKSEPNWKQLSKT